MQTDRRLGRLLPACLHQAIADELPDRLEYYEEWLSPDGLRDGRIGLAAVSAVLGFLRTERQTYGRVMRRAGVLAATWSIAELPGLPRRIGALLPLVLRTQYALRIARRIVRDVLTGSRPVTRMRRGRGTLRIADSVFCGVRDPQPRPLCDFYAALVVEALASFGVEASARPESCRAVRKDTGDCVVAIDLVGTLGAMEKARAA